MNEVTITPQIIGSVFPPVPVFHEHLEKFLELTKNFRVTDAGEFEFAKQCTTDGVSLEKEIEEAWRPFREVVEPILKRRLDTLNQLRERIKQIDSLATRWKREQDSIKEAELEKARKEELLRREEARAALLWALLQTAELRKQLAEEWGGVEVEAVVEPPPVVEPRRSSVKSEFTYRKGARTKAKLVAELVDPSAVKPEFLMPDLKKIQLTVANYGKLITHPTEAQLREFEEKIGGVICKWEEP